MAETILHGSIEQQERLRQKIWATRFGRMFRDYMDVGPNEPAKVKTAVAALVGRTYADIELTEPRQLAGLILSADVLENHPDDRARTRVALLSTKLSIRRLAYEVRSSSGVFDRLPYFIVLGALAGSPEIRAQARELTVRPWRNLRALFPQSEKSAAELSRAAATELRWRRLLGRPVLEGYEPFEGAKISFAVFGVYAVFYFQKKSESPEPGNIPQKLWIYGLQNFDRLDDL